MLGRLHHNCPQLSWSVLVCTAYSTGQVSPGGLITVSHQQEGTMETIMSAHRLQGPNDKRGGKPADQPPLPSQKKHSNNTVHADPTKPGTSQPVSQCVNMSIKDFSFLVLEQHRRPSTACEFDRLHQPSSHLLTPGRGSALRRLDSSAVERGL